MRTVPLDEVEFSKKRQGYPFSGCALPKGMN